MWSWNTTTQEKKAMEFCDLMSQGKEWSELKEFCNQSAGAVSDFVPVRTLKQLSEFLDRKIVGSDCKIKIKRGGYDKQANTACVFCNFSTSRMETHWTLVFRFDRKEETKINCASLHCTSCEKERKEKMFDSAYETLLSSTSIVSHTSMQKLNGSRVTSRRVSQIVDAPRMSPSFFKVLNGYSEYKKGCTSGQPCLCKEWTGTYDDNEEEEEESSPPPAPVRNSRNRRFSAKERKRLSVEGMKLLRRASRTMDDEEPPSFSTYGDEEPPSFSEDPPSFSASMSVGEAFRRSSMTSTTTKKKKSAPPPPRRKPSNAPPPPRSRKKSAPAPPQPRKKSVPAPPRRKPSNARRPKKSAPPPSRRNKTPPSFSSSSSSPTPPPSFTSTSRVPDSPPSFTSTSRRKKNVPAPVPPTSRRKKSVPAPAPPRRKPSRGPPPRKKSVPAPPRRKPSNARRPKKSAPPPSRRNKTPPSFSSSRDDTPPSFSSSRGDTPPPSFGASSQKRSTPSRPARRRNNNDFSSSSSRRNDTAAPPSFGSNSPSPPRFSHNNKVAPSSRRNTYDESDEDFSDDDDGASSPMPMAPPRRVFKNY